VSILSESIVLIKSSKFDSSTAAKSIALLVITEAVGTDELELQEVESSESLLSE